MTGKRKDGRGRNLRTGEYYDSKNQRYMFRKMIDGERITITATDLVELRMQENELLCKIDKGNKPNIRSAKMALNSYFDFWLETFAKSGRKATTCMNYKSYYNTLQQKFKQKFKQKFVKKKYLTPLFTYSKIIHAVCGQSPCRRQDADR